MIGWITTTVAVLLVPVAWFLGCRNVHRKDERALAQAEGDRLYAEKNTEIWEKTAGRAQASALQLERDLDAALASNSELRIERDALKLQLAEATAKNSSHAQVPTRPKQGKPPHMATGKDGKE